ncbi:PEP/pyruvate-binding domain-containing protein [Oerskovia enterophila]|uniref:Phosphoenolpyruvate synthase n=1 Tax=Oerskovia enterophila TaxID=43678 RepID=A0ABX2Y8K2_9CELL|nr:PEP/pyruvate-binding domain-containing protein [Oerskovia enterophila]OCI31256.1 phosphoenolpyruvate synthase [Oerskovia enterophila]
MIIPLAQAERETCGGKAGTLGMLARAGFAVPDGFVVPFGVPLDVHGLVARRPAAEPGRSDAGVPLPTSLVDALARGLRALGDPPVAVRSSAAGEDTARASAAGQHESFLAVQGPDAVAHAVRTCWASLHSPRATAYRRGSAQDASDDGASMAVLVQRLVDADASGVLFAPAAPGGTTEIEASWGLGPSVVEGRVTPDSYRVRGDGAVELTVGRKGTRLDRRGPGVVATPVGADDRDRPVLDDATTRRLTHLGQRVVEALGGAQDVEWALAGETLWILQARPVTADLPSWSPAPAPPDQDPGNGVLTGIPGSRGAATGPARIVRDASDFSRVRPGDVLVCPFTDPAWTPLLHVAAGVVTETGGVLSHAAIVARERRIPAVLGVPGATTSIPDGGIVTVDGSSGTVTTGSSTSTSPAPPANT